MAAAVSVTAEAVSQPLRGVDRPKRQIVSALLRLTPRHPSASVSRRFLYASLGIESLRLTLPRHLHAELLIRNPAESASRQPASRMLCMPFSSCHDRGRTALRFCHDSGSHTICAYRSDGGAVFQPGRFVLTVRELEPRSARVSLRVVFVRGPGA